MKNRNDRSMHPFLACLLACMSSCPLIPVFVSMYILRLFCLVPSLVDILAMIE